MLTLTATIGDASFDLLLDAASDISIPQTFNGNGPRLFGTEGASQSVYRSGSFVGSTKAGGSCNVTTVSITPHLDGTHTESVGHIVSDRHPVFRAATPSLLPSTVATVRPAPASECRAEWTDFTDEEDRIITRAIVEHHLAACTPGFNEALIIRTLPNGRDKLNANYDVVASPYFSLDAIDSVVAAGVRHLVVDIPSIDRMQDGGRLACHHRFFQTGASAAPDTDVRTVTELVFVDDAIIDGPYVLNLQVPAFDSDAAPSRPILVPVRPRVAL